MLAEFGSMRTRRSGRLSMWCVSGIKDQIDPLDHCSCAWASLTQWLQPSQGDLTMHAGSPCTCSPCRWMGWRFVPHACR